MAFQFHHRKLQQKISASGTAQPVKRREKLFPDFRCFKCEHTLPDLLPPPPPPMYSAHDQSNHHLHLSTVSIFFLSAFGIFSAFLIYLAFTIRNRSTWIRNNSRSRNQQAFDDTYQDFVDENHGLGLFDHPIWLINTQGLEQSVIDSIAVFKYKKGEGLIEGTDCSVCLSEFQEDESLRLLPKCSHTFHVPCIDTWLRSHKNCPLCRAPIVCVSNNVVVHTTAANQGSTEFGSGEDLRVVTSGEMEILQIREDGTSANEGNFEILVQSDLSNLGEEGEKKLKGIRRSISMDFSVVANIQEMESEGSSGAKLGQMKKPNSDSRIPSWGNMSLKTNRLRLIKSSSFNCMQKGPISMDRSFLSRGKSFLPIYGKNKARTKSESCV